MSKKCLKILFSIIFILVTLLILLVLNFNFYKAEIIKVNEYSIDVTISGQIYRIPLSEVKIKKDIFKTISLDELKNGDRIIVLQKKYPTPTVYWDIPLLEYVVEILLK